MKNADLLFQSNSMNQKTILVVTRNLPPLIGGMERLNWHIADELSKNNEVVLLSHTQAKNNAPKNCTFYAAPLNPLPLFLILVFIRTFFICLRHKPDVLFAGSGLTAPIVVFWAKLFKKKSLVYVHGLDIATNHWLYNLLWIPMIRKADRVIANSTPTKEICLRKGIQHEQISIIFPGVSYPPLAPNDLLIEELRQQYHLANKKVLISVGRLTQRKALNEFVDLALVNIVKQNPDTILVIIGDTPNQSLNKNLQSKELILSTATKHGIHNNILFVGNISDDKILSSWYYLADLHVFPVKHIPDDPEGFGMVAIEAAAHGTPTIAFKTGGIIDAVEAGVTGMLIEPNDYQSFSIAITQFLSSENNYDEHACKAYAENFSWENLKLKLNCHIENTI